MFFDFKGTAIFLTTLVLLTMMIVGLFKVVLIVSLSFLSTIIFTGRYKNVGNLYKTFKTKILFKMINKETSNYDY